jgi:tripartite-type tricarboxylate transporter receptor subunit TctC
MGNVAPNAINVSLYKRLPFDPVADFAPVSLVASTPNILVVHLSVPARTVAELIALARTKPGGLNYASAGAGSSSHLAGELFASHAGVQIVHVPYKGAGPAMVDTLSGQVELYFATLPAAIPHVKSGRLAALALTSARRSPALPGLPTIAESGLPGYEASTWYGVLAPARTPSALVGRLQAEIAKALSVPEFRERLLAQGFEPIGSTPEEFAAYIRTETEKWAKVVRASGAKAE